MESRLEILKKLLGQYPLPKANNEIVWACPFCQEIGKDTKGDNFSYNTVKNVYNCVAVSEHGRRIADLIRKELYGTQKFKTRKIKDPVFVPLNEMPQEIVDYWTDRKITLEALEHFGAKWDKANVSLEFPTPSFQNKQKLLFHEEKNRSNTKQKKIGDNTTYPVYKEYKGQKKFLYLEGEPDIWCIYSNFPKEFFDEYYVSTTLHGASHVPALWKDPKYWDNYEKVYLCPDVDTAGHKAGENLKNIIGSKAKIITLTFKHKRIVNGIEVQHTSKDFNDWIIEGGTYEQFLGLLEVNSKYESVVEKAAWDFLKSPDMLNIFLQECIQFGIVEETNNKVQLFLEGCSRLTKQKNGGISSRGQASSATGKSTLYKMIGEKFFSDDFIAVSDFSEKAMFHLPENAWQHKIIMFEEDYSQKENPSIESKQCQIRLAKSEGVIRYLYTDTSIKPFVTREGKQEGPWSIWTTCTKMNIKDEDINRDMVHHFDESSAQTMAINESQKQQGRYYSPHKELLEQFIKDKHRRIQQILKANIPDKIVIHDKHRIKFPAFLVRARRDYPRLQRYIEILAFLFQFQRQVLPVSQYLCQFSDAIENWGYDINRTCLMSGFLSDPNMQYMQELGVNSGDSQQPGHEEGGGERHTLFQKLLNQRILVATVQDIENALKHIGHDLEKEYSYIDRQVFERYQLLRKRFGVSEKISAREGAQELGISIRHFHRLMELFTELDLVRSEKEGIRWKYTLLEYTKPQAEYGKFITLEKETVNGKAVTKNVGIEAISTPVIENSIKTQTEPKKPPPSLIKKEATNEDSSSNQES